MTKMMFFLNWLKNPIKTGTFREIPKKAGKHILHFSQNLSQNDIILEIGGGSGSLTKYINNKAYSSAQSICIEINDSFCKVLRKKFENVKIIQGNAADLSEIISPEEMSRVRLIISSIPFLLINKAERNKILNQCSDIMESNLCPMLHFSYTSFYSNVFKNRGVVDFLSKKIKSFPTVHVNHYSYKNCSEAFSSIVKGMDFSEENSQKKEIKEGKTK
ncbi:rRNA adenine N-6-methyltransferase family protein [Candidatus Nesciobacter abundans]|uniref:Methyltransferase domain-containing protein n=1 Tax=Candidatus Nesciobacter abundans TaxID=2601668 RepID=A0A5C0UHM6_9PROT|nr:rRNA adenine N-6-methyltransferase family protein [Candidatus Nesciobacter abundans]QEK39063.1 methyltransferase domain-containing protein [Candidatus Nesciobacter abundans]